MKKIFSGTYEYYAKYRPGIPSKVIDVIVGHFDIKTKDRILDLGCGTGQVAIAMDGRCGEMVCIDSDPKMIEQANARTKKSKTKLIWINRKSEDLGEIGKDLGVFKVAIISRAFHWMDQNQILKDLENLIVDDGGLVVIGDKSIWTGQEEWQQAVKNIVQKYLGEERRAGEKKFKQSNEPWESLIAKSAFKFTKVYNVPIIREWDVESIIGWLFSSSFASPNHFGDKLDSFKKDVKNTLLGINHEGIFKERTNWSIIIASKSLLK